MSEKSKSDRERLAECLRCKFFDTCFNTVRYPEEYKDGTCRTKDLLEKQQRPMEGAQWEKS